MIVAYDEAGNRAAGVAVVVFAEQQNLLVPVNGATISAPRRFAWRPVPGADYYNIQFWHDGKKLSVVARQAQVHAAGKLALRGQAAQARSRHLAGLRLGGVRERRRRPSTVSSMSTPPSSSGDAEPGRVPDVLVVGRLLADIYPNQLEHAARGGRELHAVRRRLRRQRRDRTCPPRGPRRASCAGSATTATASSAARSSSGKASTWLGRRRLRRTAPALAFCEAWPPDHFPITYYRTPTCPTGRSPSTTSPMDDAPRDPVGLLTGTGLARSPSRDVHFALAEERSRRPRPCSTSTGADAVGRDSRVPRVRTGAAPVRRRRHRQRERVRSAFGTATPSRSRARVLALGPRIVDSQARRRRRARAARRMERRTSPASRSRSSTASAPGMPSAPRCSTGSCAVTCRSARPAAAATPPVRSWRAASRAPRHADSERGRRAALDRRRALGGVGLRRTRAGGGRRRSRRLHGRFERSSPGLVPLRRRTSGSRARERRSQA